jgi:uncharacterized protein YjdB
MPDVLPNNATNKAVKFSSSNPKVAVVNAEGQVTAMSYGVADIIATTVDGGFMAKSQIIVDSSIVPVISIKLIPKNINLLVGEEWQITPVVLPDTATEKSVSFLSSNPAVLIVDSGGFVRAINSGSAAITARTYDGNFEDICNIVVSYPFISVESINLTPNNTSIAQGDSIRLLTTILPDNASDKAVEFSSSNPKVATVESDGLVKGISKGIAYITVVAKNGGQIATSQVAVGFIPISEINIWPAIDTVELGKTQEFMVSILPDNVIDKDVLWTTSNSSVGIINQGGVFTALMTGLTTITASARDGTDIFETKLIKVINSIINYNIEDVQYGGFAENDIRQMYYRRFTNGCSYEVLDNEVFTKYCPNKLVEREQMAAFLYAIAGAPPYIPPAKSPFLDLDNNNIFYTQIMWGVANGIWSGYPNDTFMADKKITRSQFMTTLWRFYGSPRSSFLANSPFTDIQIKDIFYEPVIWAAENGITSGFREGTFKPSNYCTRSQMAIFIIKADDKY